MAPSPWKLTFANPMAIVFLLFLSIAVKVHAGRHPKAPQIGLLNLPTSWSKAHATFYGDESAAETMGGACGYGNLHSTGYGTDTAALSTVLFHNGYSCGACFELKCVESPHCAEGKSIVLTATNLCPPNWAQDSNDGGWCNPPREHFDMSKPAFLKIVANWRAGIVPVMYRRIPCAKQGGIRFHFQGNAFWLLAFVMNVGGSGDIAEMWVKGEKTEWLLMSHNWGASYQAFETLQGQTLSFKITSFSTKKTIVCSDVAPSNWNFGLTYEATINFS